MQSNNSGQTFSHRDINPNEKVYLDFLEYVRQNGEEVTDRTGVGTKNIFGTQVRYDLRQGFPLLTSRKLNLKTALSEILWILEGSGDERRLAELRFGKPREELVGKKTVWTANANAPYWIDKKMDEGDLGRVYGVQARQWITKEGSTIDQIEQAVHMLKTDPQSRRNIVMLWNPAELDKMCLPPCHLKWNFYVTNGRLDMLLYMRSNDLFLGKPCNTAEYALLIHMLAQVCNLEVGSLIFTTGSAHIYLNHLDAVDEQLGRMPLKAPKLIMNPDVKNIFDFKMEDFELEGYNSWPAISAEMAV